MAGMSWSKSSSKGWKGSRAASAPAVHRGVTTVYFDGGCSPNPGQMSAGIVVCRDGMAPTAHEIKNLGYGTNNVAEWAGLLWAVTWLRDQGISTAVLVGDSKLAVNQARGVWRAHDATLAGMLDSYRDLSKDLELDVRHVRRDHNLAGIYLEHGRI